MDYSSGDGRGGGKDEKGIVYLVSLIGVSNTRRPFFPAEIDWARPQAQPGTPDDVPRPACKYAYSPSIIITLQCGLSLCSQGKDERADCSLDGMLTIVPRAGKTCPTDGSGVPDGGTAEIEGTNGDGGTHTTIPCASR